MDLQSASGSASPDDHIESPKRKKPRLAAKVTINLRTTNVKGSHDHLSNIFQSSQTDNHAIEEPEDSLAEDDDENMTDNTSLTLQESETLLESQRASCPDDAPSDTSSVDEISLDEADDENADYDLQSPFGRPSLIEERLLAECPIRSFMNEDDPTVALHALFNQLGKANCSIDLKMMDAIANWFQQWLDAMQPPRKSLPQIYARHREFWNLWPNIMGRILTSNKLGLPREFLDVTDDDAPLNILNNFFCRYMDLVNQFLSMDLEVLKEVRVDTSSIPGLWSMPHLKIVQTLFCESVEVSLWRTISRKTNFDVMSMKIFWCNQFLAKPENLQANLVEMVTLSSGAISRFKAVPDFFSHSLNALSSIADCVTHPLVRGSFENYSQLSEIFAITLSQAMTEVEENIFPIISQTVPITTALIENMRNTGGKLLYAMTFLDPSYAMAQLPTDIIAVAGAEIDECADLLQLLFQFRLLWRCILKGRMELRVYCATSLAKQLVEYWRTRANHAGHGSSDWVVQAICKLMQDNGVVEYIVSAESHPEIVAHSDDVFGFLLIGNHWTQKMTTATMATIISGLNPRLIAELVLALSRCIIYANLDTLLAFFTEMGKVPITAVNREICLLLDLMGDQVDLKMKSTGDVTTTSRMIPITLCVRLLREAFSEEPARVSTNDQTSTYIHVQLQKLLASMWDPSIRIRLYRDCIDRLNSDEINTAGDADCLRALVETRRDEPMFQPSQQDSMTTISGRNICSSVEHAKASKNVDISHVKAFLARLKTFSLLWKVFPECETPLEAESALWDHLVGVKAINSNCRDWAWAELQDLLRFCGIDHPLIERCMEHHLTSLDVELRTIGFCQFVDMIMHVQSQSQLSSLTEHDVVHLPFTAMLWQTVLLSPFQDVADMSSALLARSYLDLTHRGVPLSSIFATHSSLTEQCVTELVNIASRLKLNLSVPTSTEDQIPSEKDVILLDRSAFSRALSFLTCLIIGIRNHSGLRRPSIDVNIPSPEISAPSNLNGTPLSFKYQIFDHGVQTGIHETTLDSLTTHGELYDLLRLTTKFKSLKVIAGGLEINLLNEPSRSIQDLGQKGFIMVRNVDDQLTLKTPIESSGPQSAAEGTIMKHFDSIYEFLNLDEELSTEVSRFLEYLPPSSLIRSMITSEDPPLEKLFPHFQMAKTKYTCVTLMRHLTLQSATNVQDESFVQHTIVALISTIVSFKMDVAALDHRQYCTTFSQLFTCLLSFLRELSYDIPEQGTCLKHIEAIVDRSFDVLEIVSKGAYQLPYVILPIYRTLLECVLRSEVAFETLLRKESSSYMIHDWLLLTVPNLELRKIIGAEIQSICKDNTSGRLVEPQRFIKYYWGLLNSMVLKLDETSPHLQFFFCLLVDLLPLRLAIYEAESTSPEELGRMLRQQFTEWARLLVQHHHTEVPGQDMADQYTFWMTRLMRSWLPYLTAFKKPLDMKPFIRQIFTELLFPGTYYQNDSKLPVLTSETRNNLYGLCISLCEDFECFSSLIDVMSSISDYELDQDYGWAIDRTELILSTTGSAGLTNLRNTCYMNSLLTQLFSNRRFRDFMLHTELRDANAQRVLIETQKLFADMQFTQRKYSSTADFTASLHPPIDVRDQMDVDEFFNSLFDQWEAQLLTPEARKQFRSYYGGNQIMQIKSHDCPHVSHREEPFFVIQCDIKGRRDLRESLSAYVEGDVMEGDNKYKCETCGGRYVNAIRRSCLKDVPDNLIFNLKRIDFDLLTLSRNKINDRFEFSHELDMAPYNVKHLDNPTAQTESDMFQLVGVLVHSGSVEHGHYYSFIKDRKASASRKPAWAIFDDRNVKYFDVNELPGEAFGGLLETHNPEWELLPKCFSAYMLFYERVSTSEDEHMSPISTPVVDDTLEIIKSENQAALRHYSLFDTSHTRFIQQLLTKLGDLNNAVCSESHQLEDSTICMALDHFDKVASRTREINDAENLMTAITKAVSSCERCCAAPLHWLDERKLLRLLVIAPFAKIRNLMRQMILYILHEARQNSHDTYGIDVNVEVNEIMTPVEGSFADVIDLLIKIMPLVGRYARYWTEYFELWAQLAEFGHIEAALILDSNIIVEVFEMMSVESNYIFSTRRHQENREHIIRLSKKGGMFAPKFMPLANLITTLVPYLQVYSATIQDGSRLDTYDPSTKRLRMNFRERSILRGQEFRTVPFLTKAFDTFSDEGDEEDDHHQSLIRQFLDCGPSVSDLRKISQTISDEIPLYNFSHIEAYLKAGVEFCMLTHDIKAGSSLINTVVHNCKQLERAEKPRTLPGSKVIEFAPQGGESHRRFLAKVAYMDKTECATADNPRPFREDVIESISLWAPYLLLFGERLTQEKTLRLLRALLFPEDVEPGGLPSDQDIESIKMLYGELFAKYKTACGRHFPASVVQTMFTAMDECMEILMLIRQSHKHGKELVTDIMISRHEMMMTERRQCNLSEFTQASEEDTQDNSEFDEDEDTDLVSDRSGN